MERVVRVTRDPATANWRMTPSQPDWPTAQGRRTNASSCRSLWERVYGGVPPDATLAADGQVGASRGYPVRNSIMKARPIRDQGHTYHG